MKKIILESSAGIHSFKTLVENKVDHYCGFHGKCKDPTYCKKFKHIEDLEARKAFVVILF